MMRTAALISVMLSTLIPFGCNRKPNVRPTASYANTAANSVCPDRWSDRDRYRDHAVETISAVQQQGLRVRSFEFVPGGPHFTYCNGRLSNTPDDQVWLVDAVYIKHAGLRLRFSHPVMVKPDFKPLELFETVDEMGSKHTATLCFSHDKRISTAVLDDREVVVPVSRKEEACLDGLRIVPNPNAFTCTLERKPAGSPPLRVKKRCDDP